MERAQIVQEVIKLMATSLGIDESVITEESVIADLSRDSIQLFELLLAFENAYTVETSYDDVVRLYTVKDVVDYIARVVYSK